MTSFLYISTKYYGLNTLFPNICWWVDVKNTMIYYSFIIAFKYHGIQILCSQIGPKVSSGIYV
jgi:hypothetical protein